MHGRRKRAVVEEKRPGELRGCRQPVLVARPPGPRLGLDAGVLAPFVDAVIPGLCTCTSWQYDADVKKIDPTKKVMASAAAPTACTYAGIVPRAKQDAPSMKSQAIAKFRRAGSVRMLIHCRDRTEFVFAGLDDAHRAIPAPRQVGYSSSAGY